MKKYKVQWHSGLSCFIYNPHRSAILVFRQHLFMYPAYEASHLRRGRRATPTFVFPPSATLVSITSSRRSKSSSRTYYPESPLSQLSSSVSHASSTGLPLTDNANQYSTPYPLTPQVCHSFRFIPSNYLTSLSVHIPVAQFTEQGKLPRSLYSSSRPYL